MASPAATKSAYPTTFAGAPEVSQPTPGGDNKIDHFLQRIKLFSALSYDDCQQIVKRMKRRDFPPSTFIVREGTPGTSMFFITAGAVEVRKKDPHSGIDFLLTELGPGQNFGELSLLTGNPRTASVQTIQPTTCAILEQADFQALILQYPKIGIALTTVLAERVAQANSQLGIEFINLSKMQFDARVLGLLPEPMINQLKVIPVGFLNNRLSLAMVNPNNIIALDDVRRVIKGVMIEPVVTTEEDFRKFMSTTYHQLMKKNEPSVSRADVAAAADAKALADAPKVSAEDLDLMQNELIRDLDLNAAGDELSMESKQELMIASEDAPIIKLANSSLGLAIKKGASDIHVEPMEKEVYIRYRIDGVLQTIQTLPKKVQMGLISRMKIVSKLDISEKRLPQDGRISVNMEGRPIDFRVSTIPCKWGEKVCMRILDKSNTMMGLEKLVDHEATLALIRELINQPYGIMYVTGPTGSGKTTTLYSALAEINDPGINISTAEDPIEYDLKGVNQVQANKDIGLDFARVLRAFLRQDPDVLLVGETRDKETAHISVEAALTGHLVFTTLHTNSAAGAFMRLNEMGIEPFLVSSSAIGVMAQRLARRLCKQCKEAYKADDATCDYMSVPRGSTLYKAKGCDACNGKGVRGRVGIYEVMKMGPELRQMVAKNAQTELIHAKALELGMLDLRRYAAWLLVQGLTSVEEVLQVVSVQD